MQARPRPWPTLSIWARERHHVHTRLCLRRSPHNTHTHTKLQVHETSAVAWLGGVVWVVQENRWTSLSSSNTHAPVSYTLLRKHSRISCTGRDGRSSMNSEIWLDFVAHSFSSVIIKHNPCHQYHFNWNMMDGFQRWSILTLTHTKHTLPHEYQCYERTDVVARTTDRQRVRLCRRYWCSTYTSHQSVVYRASASAMLGGQQNQYQISSVTIPHRSVFYWNCAVGISATRDIKCLQRISRGSHAGETKTYMLIMLTHEHTHILLAVLCAAHERWTLRLPNGKCPPPFARKNNR